LSYFDNNPQRIWSANGFELKKVLEESSLEKFLHERQNINPTEEWEKLLQLKINILLHPSLQPDSSYPYLLAQIPDPPPLLYIKGKIDPDFAYRIGVIGSRKVSIYGQQVTEDIVYNLAANKIIIVSGLAQGVDTIAHWTCLKAKTPTFAVLANSLDSIYPITNINLVQEIIYSGGAVISELSLGTPPLKQNFPQRNRIISGLCQAIVITEATLKSGSLLTARHALEQNRDVFAVPGSIYNQNSEGTNNLIKQGAKLITTTQDILTELNLQNTSESVKIRKVLPSSATEQIIYDNLSKEPTYIDDLIKKVNLSAGEVNSALTLMEIKGMVRNLGGNQYVII
jgi:DNA processing protein